MHVSLLTTHGLSRLESKTAMSLSLLLMANNALCQWEVPGMLLIEEDFTSVRKSRLGQKNK